MLVLTYFSLTVYTVLNVYWNAERAWKWWNITPLIVRFQYFCSCSVCLKLCPVIFSNHDFYLNVHECMFYIYAHGGLLWIWNSRNDLIKRHTFLEITGSQEDVRSPKKDSTRSLKGTDFTIYLYFWQIPLV